MTYLLQLVLAVLCIIQSCDSLLCPVISSNLVAYKVQPRENDKLDGSCLPHSVVPPYAATTPYIVCRENGNYTLVGECVCKKGYFQNATSCQECPEGTTKPDIGNSKCIRHGRNTIECDRLTRVCPCKEKFFRLVEEVEVPGSHCYEPGRVQRILYSNKTDGSVIIKWHPTFKRAGFEYKTVYNVAINNGQYRSISKRVMKFPSSNRTERFKISIITEVTVGEAVYRGDEFSDTFMVHRYTYSSANQILSSWLVLLLAMAAAYSQLQNS